MTIGNEQLAIVRHALAAAAIATCTAVPTVHAQTSEDATTLSHAYSALAAGRAAEAEALARRVLDRSPRDHGAVGLAVLAATRRSAEAGLEVYEQWLKVTGHEDAFTLEPVAFSVLGALSDKRSGVDVAARRLLARLAGEVDGGASEGAEARTRELMSRLSSDTGGNKVLALREIARTGAASAVPQIVPLLDDPSPDTRAAAAEALGQLRGSEAVPALQRA